MIVFGDRVRSAEARGFLVDIETRSAAVVSLPAGIVRHGALCGLLLLAGELAQGLADAAQSRAGFDDTDPQTEAALRLVRLLAAALLESWRNGFAARPLRGVARLSRALRLHDLPAQIEVRTAEGFAFYAVYPEAYAQAARRLGVAGSSVRVIGVRSIGTVLAATVAETLDTSALSTVRPVGHPFARIVRASARLRAVMVGDAQAAHVIVDEGPGASGSSFGAVADLLEGCGVPRGCVAFLPSHEGAPGAMASERHRSRWEQARRVAVSFDALSLESPRPEHWLSSWFEDLVGPVTVPLADISAGVWRSALGVEAPCVAGFERRKFLLRTRHGTWLAKFAGLGEVGEQKLALARQLHAGGLVPEPIGLRHGFILERWHHAATRPRADCDMVAVLGRYLAFRARYCPAGTADGANLESLCSMARHNAREQFGEAVAARLPLDPACAVGPRVRVDGRLHAWEWLHLADGRVLKADALDHHGAHDAIGCQPIAWDIAGAIVEFRLSNSQGELLRAIIDRDAGLSTDPSLVATYTFCYSAFQLGLWQHADDAGRHIERYERRLSLPQCPP